MNDLLRNLTLRAGAILGWGIFILLSAAVAIDLSDEKIPHSFWWLLGIWISVSAIYAVIEQGVLLYFLRRLLEAVFAIFIIATLTFLMLRFLPGGPFDQEKALSPEVKENIERKYGLNEPLLKQYANYLNGLAHGDLGESYKYVGRSVSDIIADTFPISFQLGFYSLLLAFLIGLPLGLFAASRHNTFWDQGAMLMAVSGVSLPSFIVGPMLVLFFSFGIPFSGLKGFLPPALWESPVFYILPVVTLGIRPAGIIARLVRSSVLEIVRSDFIRTAEAKGLSHFIVLYKHVLKNSLLPVLSLTGPLIAGLLSGSFVNEIIFAVPGMGKHLVQSVTNRDYPLVLGLTLVYAVLLLAANLLTDLVSAVIDPRIEYK
jgi:oligopeptide transport system permease protein